MTVARDLVGVRVRSAAVMSDPSKKSRRDTGGINSLLSSLLEQHVGTRRANGVGENAAVQTSIGIKIPVIAVIDDDSIINFGYMLVGNGRN
mmetsp:Transcript_18956/g.39089  ORF Transcript_18956/g.39089 Transcript_18956/m.39089 type:complete len:91 (-) Transcript_18956:128-400(-)